MSTPGRTTGGLDGWAALDRIVHEAPIYLKPQGRLVIALFVLLGVQRVLDSLRAVDLDPRILAREEQPFPRIARERLEYIRSVDAEAIFSAGRPATCPRLVICWQKELPVPRVLFEAAFDKTWILRSILTNESGAVGGAVLFECEEGCAGTS